MKKTILVFIGYYLPGYKSGGPVRTISNMLDLLGKDYNFKIITRDRDSLDDKSYENIKVNEWNDGPNCQIYYVTKNQALGTVINNTSFDQYYLNSFFDITFSAKIVFLHKLKLIPQKLILLAPRGELMEGALSIKPFKKRVFLFFAKFLNFYKNLTWHASSEYESADIKREFGDNSKIKIALDVPNYKLKTDFIRTHKKEKGKLKILFISGIVPKKNLKFAIEVLNKVKGDFTFDIYGPIKDEKYWEECQKAIDDKIKDKVKYKGTIPNDEIHNIYPNYDLFFFPTLGENYGHVIYESLFYGCPVLCSDKTPWDKLEEFNCGWNINRNNFTEYQARIEELISIRNDRYLEFVNGSNRYLENVKNSTTLNNNFDLFKV